jgi:hypothetical protein
VTTSFGKIIQAPLRWNSFVYKDEVLMRDCSVAWVRPAEPSRIAPRMRTRPKAVSTSGGVLPFSGTCGSSAPGPGRQMRLSRTTEHSFRFVGKPSVTRPNGQRRVGCGLPVIRPESGRLGSPVFVAWMVNGLPRPMAFRTPQFPFLPATTISAFQTRHLSLPPMRFPPCLGCMSKQARPTSCAPVSPATTRKASPSSTSPRSMKTKVATWFP